jgi:lipid II isoglutaminyl synthase (glutamine-hydrolysing)
MRGRPRTPDRFAAAAVTLVNAVSRALGRGEGTVVGGRVGLALDPHLLGAVARGRPVVLVSGTNGKTTTTAMVARGWGTAVATNDTGSNMREGLVAALAGTGRIPAALEVDESWLAGVAAQTRPRVVTLMNLSRDQLDRANEVRRVALRWREMCATLDATVVANAADPLVAFAAETASRVVWCDVPTPWRRDAVSCPHCTRPIRWGPAGWSSPCGFAQPSATTTLRGDDLVIDGARVELALSLPGAMNRANAALALTALAQVGVDPADAAGRLSGIAEVAGRYARRRWRGGDLRLILAKNPAGFAAALEECVTGEGALWIAVNDRVADGKDPSWLYDVPFEQLAGRVVTCLGERRLDLATRLDYGGVTVVVADAPPDPPSGPVTLIANYTAFQEWNARTSP